MSGTADGRRVQLVVDPDSRSTPDDGVDWTLIRYCLSITPTERLYMMQHYIRRADEAGLELEEGPLVLDPEELERLVRLRPKWTDDGPVFAE